MAIQQPENSSPKWSSNTKLVVALTFVALITLLLINFRQILGPLLVAFVLAYFLYPFISFLNRKLHIPWRLAAGLLYILIFLSLLGLLTWGGFALFGQIQNLIKFLQTTINNLPTLFTEWTAKPLMIGPFTVDLTKFDLSSLSQQLLGMVQFVLSKMGTIIGSVASTAATTIGWMIFIILFAYFTTSETEGRSEELIHLKIPGYAYDIKRMGQELAKIWNGFLRGQITIILITIVVYTIILGILGVRYFFGIAILAGLARLLPYIGPAITWITLSLVCIFQGTTFANLLPVAYAILSVGIGMAVDWVLDNLVNPKLMSNALRIHPAAVMITVLVAAVWLGLIGMVLAAPVLATIKLVMDYSVRKLFDLDPWEGMKTIPKNPPLPRWILRLQKRIKNIRWPWITKASP